MSSLSLSSLWPSAVTGASVLLTLILQARARARFCERSDGGGSWFGCLVAFWGKDTYTEKENKSGSLLNY